MPKNTAGILVYRVCKESQVEVFLAHPGGPYWKGKDYASWTIPKGEFEDERPLDAALREFTEETGQIVDGEFHEFPVIRLSSKKTLYAFAVEANPDAENIVSNDFALEWPPKSGVMREFPEIDRASWFSLREAYKRITVGQKPVIDKLLLLLDIDAAGVL